MVVARVSPVCRLCKPECACLRVPCECGSASGVQSGLGSAEGGERNSPPPGLLDGDVKGVLLEGFKSTLEPFK